MLLLTAGADPTGNSTAAIIYWIYKTPAVLQKLRSELDEALRNSKDLGLPPSEIVVRLEEIEQEEGLRVPLQAGEEPQIPKRNNRRGLRMFATNAFGLPHVVPDGMDVSIDGKTFLPGARHPSLPFLLFQLALLFSDRTIRPRIHNATRPQNLGFRC
ncbi:hypothetical protein M422DRAFT_258766 [Sphaerobolus stellatus SS14]|uniref:Cytochrome P450 n=1 Tax=Sphaerobolus stellatus (strain SS14) TaxID=990650 RepID=A0A0C9U6K3_SPHS4|nr:hypothetical protein M422DRAFT_258766 [Sphaerobolus stellatus SS14]